MRVLFIAPQPFYEDRGTPMAVLDTLSALSELGFEVDLATFPVGQEIALRGVRMVRTLNPLRFRSVPVGFSFRKIVLEVCLLLLVLRLARRNHYICVQGVEEGAGIALLCKALFGMPTIYDMHSSIPEQLRQVKGFKSGPGRWLALQFERWLVKGADCIVASSGLAPRVQSIQLKKKIWERSFDGCDPRPKDEELAGRLGVIDRPTVVYAGNFAPYQGLDELLEAATIVQTEIPKVAFLVVGGTENEVAHFTRRVADYDLQGTVQLHQRVPRKDVPDYLALADTVVLARTNGENTPLKLFDYLKSGKPIVATDIPAHTAVLSEETAILVAPTAEGLARGILLALKNSVHAKEVAHAAQRSLQSSSKTPLRRTGAEVYSLVMQNVLARTRESS